MSLADKYAQDMGYQDALSLLARIKADPDRRYPNGLAAAIEYSIQDAVIRALRVIDKSNEIEGGN